MLRTLSRAASILGFLAVAAWSLRAQDVSDYRPVDKAVTSRVNLARTPTGGIAAYLGVRVAADAQGKLAVADVQTDSPAAKAGVRTGDVIVQVDGQAVARLDRFRDLLQSKLSGETVKLALLRDDKPLEVTATLAAVSRPMQVPTFTGPRALLGLQVGEQSGDGVPIEQIAAGSPAERAKLKVGALLLKLDGKQVTGPAQLRDLLAEKRPNDSVTLTVQSEDKTTDVKVQLISEEARGGRGGFGFRGGGGGVQIPIPLYKKDVYRLAVVCLEFPDIKHNEKLTAEEWEAALFSRNAYLNKDNATGQKVFGSLNDYFQENSAGKFHIEGKVFKWVEAGKKRGDYVQGSGTSNRTALPTEVLGKLLARDGKDALKDFDGLFFIYAGDAVRGNRGSLYSPHAGTLLHEGKRWHYMLAPEGGSRMSSLSVFCREFAFLLGLPDLAARTENAGSEGLGVWCMLSSPLGNGRPQHLCAWAKEQLGWLSPAVLDPTVKQKLILSGIEGSAGECYKVLIKPDGSEYLLLENRKKTGFDAELPAEGMLIWRVIDNRPTLEESHGVEGANGPRVFLHAVPYPSQFNNTFTPYTTPSSRSPRGGGLPVHLTEIRRLADGRVTFHVGFEYQ